MSHIDMEKKDSENFVKVVLQLQSFYDEISSMAKKAPDNALNKFKLKFINETLADINEILGDSKPFKEFGVFDVEDIPTNSDVTVILSQYIKSAAKFYTMNTRINGSHRYWIIDNKTSQISIDRIRFLEII